MPDPFIKRVELGLRRLLIILLRFLVKRGRRSKSKINLSGPLKILFIRQDRIGDVLVSTPLFKSVKDKYPDAMLDILLSRNNYFVLDNDPLIRKRWIYKKNIGSIIQLICSIRKEKYDYAIDLMDNPSATSTILCLLSGASFNVGLEKENSYIYDIFVPMLSRKDTHIVERIAQLLIPLGICLDINDLKIRYFTSLESDSFAEKYFSNVKMQHRPVVGINISAGKDTRFWGEDNYRSFLDYLKNRYPELSAVILFKPSDFEKAKRLTLSNDNIAISPVTDNFDKFAAMIKKLSVLVSPDTSAIHLAAAFNIPSVVLYIQSNINLRIWEPFNAISRSVITKYDDLSMIPVEDVISAFDSIVKYINPASSNKTKIIN